MEARNWNLEKAKKMLEETLEWRSNYKPHEIRWVSNRYHFYISIRMQVDLMEFLKIIDRMM